MPPPTPAPASRPSAVRSLGAAGGAAIDGLARLLFRLAGLCLLAMMASVVLDVGSRALFTLTGGAVDLTFIGGVEIGGTLLLAMVLLALPHALERGQVVVDLLTDRLPERIRRVLWTLFFWTIAALGAGMAWRFGLAAQRVAASGETTQDLLIPMVWHYGGAAFATAVLGLRAGLVGARLLAGAPLPREAGRPESSAAWTVAESAESGAAPGGSGAGR